MGNKGNKGNRVGSSNKIEIQALQLHHEIKYFHKIITQLPKWPFFTLLTQITQKNYRCGKDGYML